MDSWQLRSEVDRLEPSLGDPTAIAALWREDTSAVVLFDEELRISQPLGFHETSGDGPMPEDLFLGRVQGRCWFARRQRQVPNPVSLRNIDKPAWQRQLLVRAKALFEWHATKPVCEICQGQTGYVPGGSSRQCLECGEAIFPRTDPAVIVGVLDPKDRLLLAHNTAWEEGRVSILAGFVEAGESAEQACHREILEEAGLSLTALRFVGSQPWPFPRSLMLGFVARSQDEVRVDGVELAWGKFFEREEFRQAVEERRISPPGQASIAARIIDEWMAGTLPNPEP